MHILGGEEGFFGGVCGCFSVKDIEVPGEQKGLWDSLCLAGMGSGRRL